MRTNEITLVPPMISTPLSSSSLKAFPNFFDDVARWAGEPLEEATTSVAAIFRFAAALLKLLCSSLYGLLDRGNCNQNRKIKQKKATHDKYSTELLETKHYLSTIENLTGISNVFNSIIHILLTW